MKNVKLFFVFVVLFLITGCGSDIKCKNSYDDLIKYDMNITADISKGNVVNATAVMEFKTSEDAITMCNLNKLLDLETVKVDCDDKSVRITNYQKLLLGDNNKSISKDDFIKLLEKDGFKC